MADRLYKNSSEKIGKLKNCKRCKRAFTYYGYGYEYCPNCKKIDAQEFEKVKEYIYEHGISKLIDVVEATGVDEKTITTYLREGRLEIPDGSSYYLSCERCGTNICSGRFCQPCASTLIKEFNTTISYNEIGNKPKTEVKGKMRYFDGVSD